MVHPKMRTMSPMRQLDHLLHEVLRDASRGSSGCRMPITSSAPGSRGSSGCRMWSPGLRSPGCQALHLLHEVHEDPQDAGCELSARAMSYLSHQDQGELHDLVLDLRSRRPDRGVRSPDPRSQSPDRRSRSPDRRSQSRDPRSQSPDLRSRS